MFVASQCYFQYRYFEMYVFPRGYERMRTFSFICGQKKITYESPDMMMGDYIVGLIYESDLQHNCKSQKTTHF